MLAACGADFAFFFGSGIGGTENSGVIIVVRASDDDNDDIERAVVVSGEIPAGMHLTLDGTMEGTPEESGYFEFTVDWHFADGHTERETIGVEIPE